MENTKDEIICISSDDDENIKQDKRNDKQDSFIKKLGNNSDSHIKIEASSSNYEKPKECALKRKISEINDDISCFEKSSKMFICEKESNVKLCNIKKKEEKEIRKEKEEKEEKTLLKPKLVVKEKKIISSVEQDVFPMFISLCLQRDRSEDMKTIVNKLKRRYEQLDPKYANSKAFINFLNDKRNDIMNSDSKLFVYIAEVMNEMKNSYKGKSSLLLNNKICSPDGNKLNKNKNNLNVVTTVCSNMSYTINNVFNDNEIISTNTDNEEKQEIDPAIQRKINVILKTMEKCEAYIKKLEESEINFDDENNRANPDADRTYLQPKHFGTTGIVAVDHAITSFINSKISKRNKLKKIGAFREAIIFPDYTDILRCVTKCNELHNLNLDYKRQKKIAKDAFVALGKYLKQCRCNDYWDTFSLFLENEEDDPALKDPVLAEKLIQNQREGEKKLSNVFDTYVKKQEEMKSEDSKTSLENEEDEENSIENEDEDNDDDDVSEIDIDLDIDKEKTSSEEDENSTDGSETFKNNTCIKIKSKIEKDITKIEEICQTNMNDELKNNSNDNSNDNSKSKINNIENISNCKYNFELKSIENNTASSPNIAPHLNILPNIMFSTITNNEISIDETKEDDPNIMNKDPMDDKLLQNKEKETEEKPLLRVCSFAKPPDTWKDIQEKVDEYNENENALTVKDVIDLTQDLTQENSAVHQCSTIQIESKVLPVVKGNYKTLVIPAGKNIINVKNITNNYVRLTNSNIMTALKNDPVISPQQNTKSTTIHLSSNLSTDQVVDINNQIQNSQNKQENTTVQISQSNQIIMLPTKQKESTTQCPKTNLSISQSK
ncbi:Death domain-associated protein [Apis cerana cerana]|uniref:Death domain-associated protein 6 n=1 Tax=Apis cerana cerana TaxID=94128 RepID=A0A2A3EBV1_APICC|nr:Death domain-associated protein [Apis cerana cerana]